MRKRNGVAQLNRTHSHRKAMLRNMATSLFEHERIVTTRARGKVLRGYAERLITRARQNLADGTPAERKLHNQREVLRHIRSRDVAKKLFEDIAPRFKDRPGGYTRLIHLPERKSDAAPMTIVELVDRIERPRRIREQRGQKPTGRKKDAKERAGGKDRDEDRKGKWYDRFRRRKRDHDA
ncbi:MAG: 50S ribosomal protein L17 [Spirochaetales bacterium]|nr:50S ribosomal protein L17 [Leptospiraceae bacterium]MCP5480131.1 50S ribosomal protein L17 [Spirochaetales bacterium]MCP5485529.1 50S ribosomal protein L17 [Spirochaetales bacterium]